ncbi:hypothetical protein ASE04_28255 [Rhizobium sp. Root708]|nr:hypothetical protein ASE04_28255 [Rhizobium sp. Root708]
MRFKASTALLKLVKHVVERCQVRPAFGCAIADLLDDLALLLLDSLQLPGNALALVGLVLDGSGEVLARLSGDVIKYAHGEECGGKTGQNPILQVLAENGLLVGAARAAEAIDR